MNEALIKVSDFTLIPGPRFRASGDNSAQEFFEDFVAPLLRKKKNIVLTIDFNGTWGYPPSFTSQLGIYLKQYFGSYEATRSHVKTLSDNPIYSEKFWEQLEDESA